MMHMKQVLIVLTQGLKLLERAAGSARGRWALLLLSLLCSPSSSTPTTCRPTPNSGEPWEYDEERDSPPKPDLGIF